MHAPAGGRRLGASIGVFSVFRPSAPTMCRHCYIEKTATRPMTALAPGASVGDVPGPRYLGCHFGGSKPLARQRSAIAVDVRAAMKARAAAGSVLLAGIAAT
jgi:hypothetical protein